MNIFNDALEGCQVLERIILMDDNISKTKSDNLRFYVNGNVRIEYPTQRENERIIYNNNNHLVSVIQRNRIRQIRDIDGLGIEIAVIKYLSYNGNQITQLEDDRYDKQTNINVTEHEKNTIVINFGDYNSILVNNESKTSKIYSKIYDIKIDSNDNVYYLGDVKNSFYNELCRNDDVIGNVVSDYAINSNGSKIAGIKTIRLNNGNIQSVLFLNEIQFYKTADIFSAQLLWPEFSPDNEHLIFFEKFFTRDAPFEVFYIHYNSKIKGPYVQLEDSRYFSDDSRYYIFKYKNNNNETLEERIEL
jgi:hypothetical protein